ncbi:HAD-IA family hydrolase [Flammeovirga sp. SubArs3]|uniref:HAD-IA family hydrolase n=1 Tax=Flammeovirga sp. SubArs3 TaxID=2995316 RepID=UPI00248C00A8|nr:HAD-IA family hydrolase [Flammeovirga sp. SubArs3]
MRNKITIVFDFDGTIADSLTLVTKIVTQLSSKYRLKNDHLELSDFQNLPAKEIIKLLGLKWWNLPLFIFEVKQKMNKDLNEVKLFDQIEETIQTLNNIDVELNIMSSNSKKNINSFLKQKNLSHYFSKIYTSSKLFKKDKSILKIKNAYPNSTLIYVGDEIRDIEACQKINIPIIAVSWGYNSYQALKKSTPNYLVKKPSEIIDIVKNHIDYDPKVN